MTEREIKAAIAKGHTVAVTLDKADGTRKLVSTHKTYADAAKAMRSSKGNAVYALDDLLRSIK